MPSPRSTASRLASGPVTLYFTATPIGDFRPGALLNRSLEIPGPAQTAHFSIWLASDPEGSAPRRTRAGTLTTTKCNGVDLFLREFCYPHQHAGPRHGLAVGKPAVKKAFLVASLSVWTLGLLVGIGFSVVGQVAGAQQLPGENYQLRAERDSLKNTIDSERNQHADTVQGYLVAIDRWEFQSNMMVDSLRLDTTIAAPSGPWPHEE